MIQSFFVLVMLLHPSDMRLGYTVLKVQADSCESAIEGTQSQLEDSPFMFVYPESCVEDPRGVNEV